jgi:hypothetical protein
LIWDAAQKRRMVIARLIASLFVILCGLALRKFGYSLHLPFVVVKFGGSGLWGAMVYLLLASICGKTAPVKIAMAAILIAIGVELSRLFHTPWLDAFRLTTAGALLLGRVFSLWNILAYGAGIAAAAIFDWRHLIRVAARH